MATDFWVGIDSAQKEINLNKRKTLIDLMTEKKLVKVCVNCGSEDIIDPSGSYTISRNQIHCKNCGSIGIAVEVDSEGQKELQQKYPAK